MHLTQAFKEWYVFCFPTTFHWGQGVGGQDNLLLERPKI